MARTACRVDALGRVVKLTAKTHLLEIEAHEQHNFQTLGDDYPPPTLSTHILR